MEGEETIHSRLLRLLDESIENKEVLIVEDIIDTGKTLSKVIEILYSKGAKSVKVATLLDKPEGRISTCHIEGDYVGFTVPNRFLVGFGLDYNQKYRNLPYVGILKRECY